jgi:pimeloyl-ACP methyl ester carboxylesterase
LASARICSNANVRLSTHIADIVNLIRWESLSQVALVGHSYGGIVISGVVEQIEAAVASLTFLDALVPDNDQALADLTTPRVRDSIAAAAQSGELAVKPVPASVFKVNEKDQAWVDSLCTPHPRAAMTDRLRLTGARERIARKTYIRAKAYPSERYDGYQTRLSITSGWRVHELPCGHDAMVDMPSELTELLLASA